MECTRRTAVCRSRAVRVDVDRVRVGTYAFQRLFLRDFICVESADIKLQIDFRLKVQPRRYWLVDDSFVVEFRQSGAVQYGLDLDSYRFASLLIVAVV